MPPAGKKKAKTHIFSAAEIPSGFEPEVPSWNLSSTRDKQGAMARYGRELIAANQHEASELSKQKGSSGTMSKAASKNRWLALTDVERKEKLEREAALRTAWMTSVFAENARVRDVASARSTPRVPAPMPFHPRGAVGEAPPFSRGDFGGTSAPSSVFRGNGRRKRGRADSDSADSDSEG